MATGDGLTIQNESWNDLQEYFRNYGNSVGYIPRSASGWIISQETSSTNTPGYHELKRSGAILPPHDYSFTRKVRAGAFEYVVKRSQWPYDENSYDLEHSRAPVIQSAFEANFVPDWDEVRLKALKKLKGETWQSGVALVESRKAADLIRTNTYRFANAVRSLRRGHLGDFAEQLGFKTTTRQRARFSYSFGQNPREAASTALLETQFGWKPLLSDIHGAATTIFDSYNVPRNRLVSIAVTHKAESRVQNPSYQYEISPERYGSLFRQEKASYRIVLLFEISNPLADAGLRTGLSNPAEVLYEVTPWSFLVDYFFTLGDVISVLDATTGKTFKWGTESVRYEVSTNITNPWSSFARSSKGEWSAVTRGKTRKVLTDFPVIPLPSLKPGLKPQQLWNSIALLQQQLGGLSHRNRLEEAKGEWKWRNDSRLPRRPGLRV